MTIRIKYSENKKKIMAIVKDQELELAELVIAIMFGKEEQTIEVLGNSVPDVIVETNTDEKLEKEANKFRELLDKFYEDYYKKH